MKSKKYVIIGVIIIVLVVLILFFLYLNRAKKRLNSYDSLKNTIDTRYGKLSYIDYGSGEIILVAHGLFGGYDQAYDSVKNLSDEYRILAPSRFGYPGSDLPSESTVKDQAKAYLELINSLNIDKVFILGTSAGGSVAIRFALEYPDRVKGVILYCSNALQEKKPQESDIPKYNAVPKFFANDFMMWLATPIMKNVMNMSSDTWLSIFPISKRKEGVINDGYNANRDMDINYDDYILESIQVPVLALHAIDDKMASYEKVKNMVERFPNGSLITFETGGHMMVGKEIEVEDSLKEFISMNYVK